MLGKDVGKGSQGYNGSTYLNVQLVNETLFPNTVAAKTWERDLFNM
jgi:hypothetical protein